MKSEPTKPLQLTEFQSALLVGLLAEWLVSGGSAYSSELAPEVRGVIDKLLQVSGEFLREAVEAARDKA